MRHPIRMQIVDHQSVLSDVDQHQVENMIWLDLAPIKDKISLVQLEIVQMEHKQFGREHVVYTSTKLKNGHEVKSRTSRISKGAVLMASVAQMKNRVEQRIRFEATWLWRSLRWTRNTVHLLIQSVQNAFQLSEQNGSHPLRN